MQNNETEIQTEAVTLLEIRQTCKFSPFKSASLILAPSHKADFGSKKKKRVIFSDGGWLRGAAALPLIPRNAFTAWPITAELSANCKHTAKGRL